MLMLANQSQSWIQNPGASMAEAHRFWQIRRRRRAAAARRINTYPHSFRKLLTPLTSILVSRHQIRGGIFNLLGQLTSSVLCKDSR